MDIMKRIVTLLSSLFLIYIGAWAQDVIETKDSKLIVAKVLDVSEQEVSYKMFNNQDGPTFHLATEQLLRIVFQNGTEYRFEPGGNSHRLSADAPLHELVADGNHVFIELSDPSFAFEEKDEYLRAYLLEYTQWKVVPTVQDADFILHVDVYPINGMFRLHSATPSIRRPDGTEVWRGRRMEEEPNPYNGFKAVRGLCKEIVTDCLVQDLAADARRSRQQSQWL